MKIFITIVIRKRILFKIVQKLVRVYEKEKRKDILSKVNCNPDKVVIGENTSVMYPDNIFIGDYSYINGGFIKASEKAKIVIGKNCIISYNVHMRTDEHLYKDKSTNINKQGHKEESIIIGDDVWIGYGVQIMSGVKIGKGAVIAAGAIVTKNIEEYAVVAGIPAKVINYRK